jgi:hypothetical protein
MRTSVRFMVRAAALALAATASLGAVASPVTKPARQGPLADLPSTAGPTVDKIKSLGENQWLNLGPPAPDPTWGQARGRSWSSKMVFAPDLGGAFLHGQGVHGYIKPDGRFMDDIWFYDLYAHRWICLYPGTDTRHFVEDIQKGELRLNDDGQLVDKAGQPVPFSSISGHSYQDHTYNPDLGVYMFGGHVDGIGSEQHVRNEEWLKTGRELLLAQGKTDKAAGAPYLFNTRTGKFERPPGGAVGRAHGGAGGSYFVDLVYLPTKKTYWQHSRGSVWLADPATHRWVDAKTAGALPEGGDVGVCYDSKRDRIYVSAASWRPSDAQAAGPLFVYDVKTNAWSNPPAKPHAMAWPGANGACVHYDAAADRVLCFFGWNRSDRAAGGISVYDPETGSWEAPTSISAAVFSGCVHGFYSPAVNAHFFYVAGDSNDRGTMWVYRYKKAAER